MNIGQASLESGLPVKTIRYYEEIALVKPDRAANGYRAYDEDDLHRLRFLQRARGLGFTIQECRTLLSLYDDNQRSSADVKSLAVDKIKEIDRKIEDLKTLRSALAALAEKCQGDERSNCPIIDDLAGLAMH